MPVPDSLSVDELKKRLDKKLGQDDELLAGLLAAAFEQAQAPPPYGSGRRLLPAPAADSDPEVVERVVVIGRGQLVRVPDARTITAVTVDGVAVTDYDIVRQDGLVVALELAALPVDPYYGYRGYDPIPEPRLRRVVEITGRFGYVDLPDPLREAIYTLAARAFYERDASYADQVAVAEGAAVQAYYRQLPPRVKLAFASFERPRFVGLA